MKALTCALAFCLCLGLAACDEDDAPTGATGSGDVAISLSVQARVDPARAESNLTLSRARFLLRDLKLHQVDAPEETEFVTGPFIVDLDLAGTLNEIAVASVAVDTYDEVRFKIHKLDDDDPRDAQVLGNPIFADFTGPDRYSVIVEGSFDNGGGDSAFVFVSDLNEEQRSPLIPPVTIVEDGGSMNVTLVIDTGQWFDDGRGGLLDPRNAVNEDLIEENITRSIEVFEDRDEDGSPDR